MLLCLTISLITSNDQYLPINTFAVGTTSSSSPSWSRSVTLNIVGIDGDDDSLNTGLYFRFVCVFTLMKCGRRIAFVGIVVGGGVVLDDCVSPDVDDEDVGCGCFFFLLGLKYGHSLLFAVKCPGFLHLLHTNGRVVFGAGAVLCTGGEDIDDVARSNNELAISRLESITVHVFALLLLLFVGNELVAVE